MIIKAQKGGFYAQKGFHGVYDLMSAKQLKRYVSEFVGGYDDKILPVMDRISVLVKMTLARRRQI